MVDCRLCSKGFGQEGLGAGEFTVNLGLLINGHRFLAIIINSNNLYRFLHILYVETFFSHTLCKLSL